MKLPILFFLIASVSLALISCSSTSPDTPSTLKAIHRDEAMLEAMGRAAIIVTGTPRLDASKPSTISWLGSLNVVGKHRTLTEDQLRLQLTQIINQQIMIKGYPVVSNGGDFQLDGVVVLAGTEDAQALLRESGGMDPGLAGIGDEAHLGKGTLLLELKQGRVTRWKGSVQIYVAPQFDEAVALRRIEYVVHQLLSTWP
jgi:hypothetical protein